MKDINNSMDEICKIKRSIIEIDTKINVYNKTFIYLLIIIIKFRKAKIYQRN